MRLTGTVAVAAFVVMLGVACARVDAADYAEAAKYEFGKTPDGRVVVIAPTRAACETIEMAVGLHLETVLEAEHGEEIRDLAVRGAGFGIVAATGTGKTLAIRPIAETILGVPLRVGVVNREREATPETPGWNVVIVTTGIWMALLALLAGGAIAFLLVRRRKRTA